MAGINSTLNQENHLVNDGLISNGVKIEMNVQDKKLRIKEYFKVNGELFKKGSIIPARIIKGTRKNQCKLKFAADVYCLPTKYGHVVVSFDNSPVIVSIRGVKNATFNGSPYVINGETKLFFDFFESNLVGAVASINDLYGMISTKKTI